MKRLPVVIAIAVVLATALLVTSVAAGNGIDLNGWHYNLNLIGMKNPKNVNLDDLKNSMGHVIFVKMGSGSQLQTRIYLAEAPAGENFDIIDFDGTDGVARLQLPDPYLDPDPVNLSDKGSECLSTYQIYVRVLGAPGGTGKIATGICNTTGGAYPVCITEPGNIWYTSENVTLNSHNKGDNQKFEQVTHELTTVNIGGTHYGLFADSIYGELYFWELFNDGMKLVQLRFYPTPENYCSDGYPGPT